MSAEATDSTEKVLYSCVDGVVTLRLNSPSTANAMDRAMGEAMFAALDRVAAEPDARVVVLSAAGPRFCGGGDLAEMAQAEDRPATVLAMANAGHAVVRAFQALDVPVIAAVQGAAAGIGMSFTLGADLVVAADNAKFVTAYTSIGLSPDGGMSWLLPRLVGTRTAMELLLLSEPLGAARALELGLVNQVCPPEELDATAAALAAKLAARPTHSLAEARRLVRAGWEATLDAHLDEEAATISRMSGTAATSAMIEMFFNK